MECKHDDLKGFTLHGGTNSATCKCGKTFTVTAQGREDIREAQASRMTTNIVSITDRQIAARLNRTEPISNIEMLTDKHSQQLRQGAAAYGN